MSFSLVSAGARFRKALTEESPLAMVGVMNAYCAKLAERAGFKAIYLSGSGCATDSYGWPDLAVTGLSDVLVDVQRITRASSLPLIVDIDTGWGSVLSIERAIDDMIRAGAAGVHLEDQTNIKRCGHRQQKTLVSTKEMVDRIKSAALAKTDPNFFLIARTDALANEGIDATIARAKAYHDAGADAIFAEAVPDLKTYHLFTQALSIPVLANLTEFGQTPLLSLAELKTVGVAIALYPLTATRMMRRAAQDAYHTLRTLGTQTSLISRMETRKELYAVLDYERHEQRQQSI